MDYWAIWNKEDEICNYFNKRWKPSAIFKAEMLFYVSICIFFAICDTEKESKRRGA